MRGAETNLIYTRKIRAALAVCAHWQGQLNSGVFWFVSVLLPAFLLVSSEVFIVAAETVLGFVRPSLHLQLIQFYPWFSHFGC